MLPLTHISPPETTRPLNDDVLLISLIVAFMRGVLWFSHYGLNAMSRDAPRRLVPPLLHICFLQLDGKHESRWCSPTRMRWPREEIEGFVRPGRWTSRKGFCVICWLYFAVEDGGKALYRGKNYSEGHRAFALCYHKVAGVFNMNQVNLIWDLFFTQGRANRGVAYS